MKANKKVVAATLALSMALGVVAPASKSFADATVNQSYINVDSYKKAAEKWLKSYKNYKELADTKEKLEKDKKEKTDLISEYILKLAVSVKKQESLDEQFKKDVQEIKKQYEKYNSGSPEKIEEEKKIDDLSKKLEINLNVEIANHDLLKQTKLKYENDLVSINNELTKKYKYIDSDGKEQMVSLDKAIEGLKAIEKTKREDFVKVGGTEQEIQAMVVADKVIVPKDRTKDQEIRNKIKALETKKSVLYYIKESMPESYKKYKKQIDEAIKFADQVLKQAKEVIKFDEN